MLDVGCSVHARLICKSVEMGTVISKRTTALAALLFMCGPAAVRATPVSLNVRISVQTVGPGGLIPAANVRVDACGCLDLPTDGPP